MTYNNTTFACTYSTVLHRWQTPKIFLYVSEVVQSRVFPYFFPIFPQRQHERPTRKPQRPHMLKSRCREKWLIITLLLTRGSSARDSCISLSRCWRCVVSLQSALSPLLSYCNSICSTNVPCTYNTSNLTISVFSLFV